MSKIDVPAHCAASATTVVVLALLVWQLLAVPLPIPASAQGEAAMQVFFIPRLRPPAPVARHAMTSSTRTTGAPSPARVVPAASNARVSTPLPDTPANGVYAADGSIRLPEGVAIDPLKPVAAAPGENDGSASAAARKLLERRNPIDYRPTRFDKDWASDGTLGDVVLEKVGQRLQGFSSISRFVLGEDHPAQARPPPDVRFNPALHERPSDLGSEATGDAYKAAPIAFEHAPDLKGTASRRIRDRADELERRFAVCDKQWLQRLLAPVRENIAQLERIEYAMAHGVDPVQAEHLMPRSADRAYDLARRALWYAEKQLMRCDASG